MTSSVPDWDLEQLEVILEDAGSWQLVIAGPGTGKSAVACQRIAYLIDEGVPPSRILLVSFTRTAVAELRDRIISYSVAGEGARAVRISTIDSYAWSLRAGFDDELPRALGDGSYELSIEQTVHLFRQSQPDLLDFMNRLEHLIIDEAQDVVGLRSDLIMEMLRNLSPECGVTILADPAQAIYGFTTDDGSEVKENTSLLGRIELESPRSLVTRKLSQIYRIKNAELAELFLRTRKEIEAASTSTGHVSQVQRVIKETCGKDIGISTYDSIREFLAANRDQGLLVLFRRRADVLFVSSFCSATDIEHRLRMSALPIVVHPWLGWLLGETVQAIITRAEFSTLWQVRGSIEAAPLAGVEHDKAWALLHRLAAGKRPETVDLVYLRRIVARARPPIELCEPDLGTNGPILGTIHASKGREADTVVLVMSTQSGGHTSATGSDDNALLFEEGRVYYVGATRARKMLVAAGSRDVKVGYLESGRVYRFAGQNRAQLEVGRQGDVDSVAHLAWTNSIDIQHVLAGCVGATRRCHAHSSEENRYVPRLVVERVGEDGITRYHDVGELGPNFRHDLSSLWNLMDRNNELRPAPTINHLHLVAVTTVGLSENQRGSVKQPFNQSGFGLAPVVKGFPTIPFLFRRGRRAFQR